MKAAQWRPAARPSERTSPAINSCRSRTPPPPMTPRPATEDRRSTLFVASTGNTPDRTQVNRDSDSVKPRTRLSRGTVATGRKCSGREPQQPAQGKEPDAYARRPSYTRQQQVFDPQPSLRTCQREAPSANRMVISPVRRSIRTKVSSSDVCAGNEQDGILPRAPGPAPEVGGYRLRPSAAARRSSQLRARIGARKTRARGRSRSTPDPVRHPPVATSRHPRSRMIATRVRGLTLALSSPVGEPCKHPHLSGGRRASGQDADDRVRLALQQNGLSQHVRASAKGGLPRLRSSMMAVLGRCGRSLILREITPHDRTESQYVEIPCRDPTRTEGIAQRQPARNVFTARRSPSETPRRGAKARRQRTRSHCSPSMVLRRLGRLKA